jgi:hypothetical protein
MKHVFLTFAFLLTLHIGVSQETYTVNNETLTLKTEVEGDLDLLWTSGDDGVFRYFVKKEDNSIVELKNTKTGKDYNREYITTLFTLTQTNASDTKYTLYGLRKFIDDYNKTQDTSYVGDVETKLGLKLAVFGGITNNPFVRNPDNKTTPFASAELEVSDALNQSRHAGFANVRQTFGSDDFEYNATQLALGYRYRFVNTNNIKVYAQTKFATITYASTKDFELDETTNTFVEVDNSGTTFDAPFIFGLGADFKVGSTGSISVIYDSLFSAVFKDNYNFPMDFAIGYKFSL